MADNVAITAGAGTTIATDDIGGFHYQRVKLTHGADGTATDASVTAPIPFYDPDVTATGTITATDAVVAAPTGNGALLTGASTAGSIVSLQCPGGDSAWTVQITPQTTGAIHFEGSLNSTNGTDGHWTNINGRQTGVVNTVLAGNSATAGVYRGNTGGLAWFRARHTGTLTGTPGVVIRISAGPAATFLNASIPAGTNNIGSVTVAASTSATSAVTNVAASATSVTLKAANTARKQLMLANAGTSTLFVRLEAAAATATTGYSVQVPPNGYYELPDNPIYTGEVRGIWSATGGSGCNVTEVT